MNKIKQLSQSLEDYLEALYIISLSSKVVRVKEVAKFLEVKTPSVVDAIGKLQEKGLVTHERYGYLELTAKGSNLARGVYRKHKKVAQFFNDVLGVSDKTSKKDACFIEHYISKETFGKMIKFIKFTETSPEGYQKWLENFKAYSMKGEKSGNNSK